MAIVELSGCPDEGGMRLLALGGVPGRAYEPPAYSAVGAADPLG